MMETDQHQFGQQTTLEQRAEMDEDADGEIVDGRLVEEELPGPVHELVVSWLSRRLGEWIEPLRGFVVLLRREARRRTPSRTEARSPGVLPGTLATGAWPGADPPEVAVEVVSPHRSDVRRDHVAKHREYAAFGIRCCWLVAPTCRTVDIFELGGDRAYKNVLVADDGVLERVPGGEGLRLDLDAPWAQVEELENLPAA